MPPSPGNPALVANATPPAQRTEPSFQTPSASEVNGLGQTEAPSQRILRAPGYHFNLVMFSPDGKMMLGQYLRRKGKGTEDGIIVWSTRTWLPIHRLPNAYSMRGFSSDSKKLLTLADSKAQIWDTRSWRVLMTRTNTGSRLGAALSRDGTRLATITLVSEVPTLTVWNADTGRLVRRYGYAQEIYGFSPDGLSIWASYPGLNRVITLATGQWQQFPKDGPRDGQWALGYLPNGLLVTTNTRKFTIRVWRRLSPPRRGWQQVGPDLKGLPAVVVSLAYSRDAKVLAAGSTETNILAWETATGKVLADVQCHMRWPHVAISPDGKLLAVTRTTSAASAQSDIHLFSLRQE